LRWLTWTSLRVLEGVAASFAALAIAHFAGAGLLGTFAMVLAAFTAETTTGLVLGPVAPAIRERLTQARRATLVSDWTASLRRRADVTVLYVPK